MYDFIAPFRLARMHFQISQPWLLLPMYLSHLPLYLKLFNNYLSMFELCKSFSTTRNNLKDVTESNLLKSNSPAKVKGLPQTSPSNTLLVRNAKYHHNVIVGTLRKLTYPCFQNSLPHNFSNSHIFSCLRGLRFWSGQNWLIRQLFAQNLLHLLLSKREKTLTSNFDLSFV